MAGPWERYQQPNSTAQMDGPWRRYAQPQQQDWARRPEGDVNEIRGNPLDLIGEVGRMWGQWAAETPERAATFTENAIAGVPVAGPLAMQGMDTAAAHARSLAGQPVEQELAVIQAGAERRAQDHAEAALAGQIAGAVGPLGALGATRIGGQALGMAGTLPQRVGAGLASGGLIAGADTAARGGSFKEARNMALLGAGVGAGFPLAERAISPLVRAAGGQRPVSGEARLLNRALNDDNVPLDQVGPRLQELGPDAMIADLGPNLQRQAGALASTPGPGQQAVRQSISQRAQDTSNRVVADIERTIGSGPQASAIAEDVIARQQAAAGPLYEAVRMQRVDITPALRNIMGTPLGQRATNEAMRLAANDQIPANAGFTVGMADYMKRALDDIASAASRAGNNNQARQAGNMARVITQEVDRLVPAYRDARQAFAGPAQVLDALEEGQTVFRNTVSPDDLRRSLEGMTDSQREAYISGARSAVQEMLGTARNDALQVRNTFMRGWNQEKLKILLGEDVAKDLIRSINREMQYAATHHIVSGNSETAARHLAQGEVAGAASAQPGVVRSALNFRFGDAIASAFDRAIGSISSVQRARRNARLAANLTGGRLDPALEMELQRLRSGGDRSLIPPAGAASLITNQGGGG